MNTRFTPAKLSAAIVTLSLMSAPLYTVADEQVEAADDPQGLEQSVDDRPAIEERSYDTRQVAQELNDEEEAIEIGEEAEEAPDIGEEEQGIVEGEALMEGDENAEEEIAELDAEEEETAELTGEQEEELSGPLEDVQEAATVIQNMQADADLRQVIDQAKGVFVVPDYAVGALIVGASGGEGVLLQKQEAGEWSNPVFYDIGSISAGLQAGAAAGSIAMILLSDNALDAFRDETNFGFTADAGYSIINWSDRARASIGLGTDAVVWTDTEGLFGELAVGVTGISPDEEEIAEYYTAEAEPAAILAGEIENPHEEVLQQALMEE